MGSKNKDSQAEHERWVLEQVTEAAENSNLDDFYGFTCDDVARLQSAFQSLEQNPNTTFPDFYSETACVELFNISSSEETKRGGSSQKREEGKLKAAIKKGDDEAAKGMQPLVRTYCFTHPSHSYDNLTESLRSHCRQHLNSFRACGGSFKAIVFVIEYGELDLHCAFVPAADVEFDGVRVGDLFPIYENGKSRGPYRLSRDRENLLWLQEELSDVEFIVFMRPNRIEFINHHRADAIAACLPWRLVTAQAPSITAVTSTLISPQAKERQSNEQD